MTDPRHAAAAPCRVPPPNALVLRALGLGDFLTGLPALRLVREALPGHRIALAAPQVFGELAMQAELVDEVVDVQYLADVPRFPPLPRSPQPLDIAIDLHGNGSPSRRLLAEHHPRTLVAFTAQPDGSGRPVWDPREHEVRRWCRLVASAFGVDAARAGWVARTLPSQPLRADLPEGAAVVHPGAAAPARRWPAERFVAVARALARAGHEVVVTGSAAERSLAERVAVGARAEAFTDLSLHDLFALVERARLLVCGDTGVAHVASAYRTPSVVLFGPVSPAQWGPPEDSVHCAMFSPGSSMGSGNPHGDAPDPALLALTVTDVLQACDDVLTAASSTSDTAMAGS